MSVFNRGLWAQAVVLDRLYFAVQKQVQEFRNGLLAVIPERYFESISASDFQYILSGTPVIDVDDWKQNCQVSPRYEDSTAVRWFWEIVEESSNEEKAEILCFATACPWVPSGGFSQLKSVNGRLCPFTICDGSGNLPVDGFPTSHTWCVWNPT